MNVRLRKEFIFNSGIVYQKSYMINQYHVSISMMTSTDNGHDQNTAYERIKFWIHNVMENAVMIDESDEKISAYMETGQRVVTMPGEPLDQLVGIMLCCKLNAITENRLLVTDVEIKSICGEEMIYLHSIDENIGPLQTDGWWSDSRPKCANLSRHRNSNVVEMSRTPEWKDLGLGWEESQDSNSTVVFADFKRDETE